ncbi:MAG: metalloregulator ArsR/SmtB family transcription factor [Allorhizobium sp.]
MLKYLSASSLTAGEISSRFDMAKPSVSQHLSILETAGLVSREKRGQYVHYALVRPTVEAALSSYLAELGILPPPPVAEPEEQAPATATAPARKAKSAPAAEPEPVEKPAPAQMSMF